MAFPRFVTAAVCSQVALAENGAKSTYFNAGQWSGYGWMTSAQPTDPQQNRDDECGPLPQDCWGDSGFACGPGTGSAGGNNQVKVDGDNMILTCTATDGDGVHKPSSLNAQLYMSNGDVVDGEMYSQEVMNKQQKFRYGDFVWYIDSLKVDGQRSRSPWPTNLVIGLYLYSPNLTLNGAVDCTHELDVEYANWGTPLAFTSWPAEISTGKVGNPIRESTAFRFLPDTSCVGMRWMKDKVTYFLWESSNAMDCTQENIAACLSGSGCITHVVPYTHIKNSCAGGGTHCIDTAIADPMTPSMNLWTSGMVEKNWTEAKLTLGAFHYFPLLNTCGVERPGMAGKCNTIEPSSGQCMTTVPGCIGQHCNANGKDQDCAWCVYNMAECKKIYKDECENSLWPLCGNPMQELLAV